MSGQPGSGYAARTIPNVITVARREFVSRARTRTFRITTVVLVVAGVALALAPVLIRVITGAPTGERVEVVVGDSKPNVDVVKALGQILNAQTQSPIPVPGQGTEGPSFTVIASTDVAAARQHVVAGDSAAALSLARDANGDLAYDLYTRARSVGRNVRGKPVQKASWRSVWQSARVLTRHPTRWLA